MLHLPSATPPEEPTALAQPPQAAARPAGAWRRFLARTIDVWLTAFAVGLTGAFAIQKYKPGMAAALFDSGVGTFAFGLIAVFVAMLLDGWIHDLFGNTPGKALFGLFVTDAAGKPLPAGAYSGRNLEVWLYGLACGLPVISLFTMAVQHTNLTKRGSAGYDAGRFVVWSKPSGWVQDAMAVVAVVIVLVVQSIIAQIANLPPSEPVATQHAPPKTPNAFDQFDQKQVAQTPMQRVAAQAKARYQQLDPKSDKADPAAIEFVIAERDRLIGSGWAPHEALQLAVDAAARRFNWSTTWGAPTVVDTLPKPTRETPGPFYDYRPGALPSGVTVFRCEDGQGVYFSEGKCAAPR